MWQYEKKLQYPVKIKNPNPRLAGVIVSQLGGPDGELGAATRYLNQRYTMPSGEAIGTLTDIGSEELGHCEMIAAVLYQLVLRLFMDVYFSNHTFTCSMLYSPVMIAVWSSIATNRTLS